MEEISFHRCNQGYGRDEVYPADNSDSAGVITQQGILIHACEPDGYIRMWGLYGENSWRGGLRWNHGCYVKAPTTARVAVTYSSFMDCGNALAIEAKSIRVEMCYFSGFPDTRDPRGELRKAPALILKSSDTVVSNCDFIGKTDLPVVWWWKGQQPRFVECGWSDLEFNPDRFATILGERTIGVAEFRELYDVDGEWSE